MTTAEPLIAFVRGEERLLGRRRARLASTLYAAAQRAPQVEALDRAVAHVEADVAAGRLHVLDDRAAFAREIQVEAAGAAEVRLGSPVSAAINGSSCDAARAPVEREPRVVARGAYVEVAGERAAVELCASVLELQVAAADQDAAADVRELHPRELERADVHRAVDVHRVVLRQLDVAGRRFARLCVARLRRQIAIGVDAVDIERETVRRRVEALQREGAFDRRLVEREHEIVQLRAVLRDGESRADRRARERLGVGGRLRRQPEPRAATLAARIAPRWPFRSRSRPARRCAP